MGFGSNKERPPITAGEPGTQDYQTSALSRKRAAYGGIAGVGGGLGGLTPLAQQEQEDLRAALALSLGGGGADSSSSGGGGGLALSDEALAFMGYPSNGGYGEGGHNLTGGSGSAAALEGGYDPLGATWGSSSAANPNSKSSPNLVVVQARKEKGFLEPLDMASAFASYYVSTSGNRLQSFLLSIWDNTYVQGGVRG
jgi:hypothetical protein